MVEALTIRFLSITIRVDAIAIRLEAIATSELNFSFRLASMPCFCFYFYLCALMC